MEMDLIAHCGTVNAGSYVSSLVMTDVVSGWTECAPVVVRSRELIVETVERMRQALPFPLLSLDTDNGVEFVNEVLVAYCAKHGLGLTCSRPYLKNDQAWIEQKNVAVVRRMVGYARLEGITAGQALGRLYSASQLFVNFFQPSFKLAEKHREGFRIIKRYLAPATPAARLMSAECIPAEIKTRLKDLGDSLDPLAFARLFPSSGNLDTSDTAPYSYRGHDGDCLPHGGNLLPCLGKAPCLRHRIETCRMSYTTDTRAGIVPRR